MSFGNLGDLIPGLGNPFGLPSSGVWNLQQGSFKTPDDEIVFFVENKIGQFPNQYTAIDQVSDGGGRRLATYEYPYVDGQAVQDLGRKGEKFTMNIKFFGSNYQILFKDFIEIVTKSNKKGILNHPVRGSFNCRFLEWEFVHRHDEWNAVTIKAVFIEDDTDIISKLNLFDSINSALRKCLQVLSSVQSAIITALSAAVDLKHFPVQLLANLKLSLASIVSDVSKLLGQIAAGYSLDSQIQALFAASSGNVTQLSSGTVTPSPVNPTGQLPPVFQVGFSPADQQNINTQVNNFVASNQITPQQALYAANQIRTKISAAIEEINSQLGNEGYTAVIQYRILAIQVQQVTQIAITSSQSQIKVYTLPKAMSLRMVAFVNGLAVDRQNDIEALNPFLGSVNFIPAGTMVKVPAA